MRCRDLLQPHHGTGQGRAVAAGRAGVPVMAVTVAQSDASPAVTDRVSLVDMHTSVGDGILLHIWPAVGEGVHHRHGGRPTLSRHMQTTAVISAHSLFTPYTDECVHRRWQAGHCSGQATCNLRLSALNPHTAGELTQQCIFKRLYGPSPRTHPSLLAQVFVQMYRHHPQFHILLEGMDTETADIAGGPLPGGGGGGSPEMARASSLLAGTFTTAALNALSISEDALPPPEQLLAMMEDSGGDLGA